MSKRVYISADYASDGDKCCLCMHQLCRERGKRNHKNKMEYRRK